MLHSAETLVQPNTSVIDGRFREFNGGGIVVVKRAKLWIKRSRAWTPRLEYLTLTRILNDLAARKCADGAETWSEGAAIPRESDRNEPNGVALETTRSARNYAVRVLARWRNTANGCLIMETTEHCASGSISNSEGKTSGGVSLINSSNRAGTTLAVAASIIHGTDTIADPANSISFSSSRCFCAALLQIKITKRKNQVSRCIKIFSSLRYSSGWQKSPSRPRWMSDEVSLWFFSLSFLRVFRIFHVVRGDAVGWIEDF